MEEVGWGEEAAMVVEVDQEQTLNPFPFQVEEHRQEGGAGRQVGHLEVHPGEVVEQTWVPRD